MFYNDVAGARMNTTVKHEVLVVTDGQSNVPKKTLTRAAALRQTGVVVYALGIGTQCRVILIHILHGTCASDKLCCLHLKMEFRSCARVRQWCGIIHYY